MTNSTKWKTWEEVPLVLGLQDVADLLGVHYNTVKKMAQDGRLPAVKVGRAWKVKRETVRAMLEAGEESED
jgi:excisionase family DNA binding protein